MNNIGVRTKIFVVFALPMLMLVALSGFVVNRAYSEATQADQVANVAEQGTKMSRLADGLRWEMGLSALALTSTDPALKKIAEAQLAEVRAQIDAAGGRIRHEDFPADAVGPFTAEFVAASDGLFELVPPLREKVDAGQLTPQEMYGAYHELWRKFTPAPSVMANDVDSAELAVLLRGYSTGEAMADAQWLEALASLSALNAGAMSPQAQAAIVAAAARNTSLREEFDVFNNALDDPLVLPQTSEAIEKMRGIMLATPPGAVPEGVTPAAYFGAFKEQADVSSSYSVAVTERFGDLARAEADEARVDAWVTLASTVVAALFGLFTAFFVSRSVSRRIVRLTRTCEQVHELLPKLVRSGHGEGDDEDIQLPVIEARAKDEIGRLARAFTAVNSTTVASVRDQALLRRAISAMFVNIARRDQVLLGRQLAFLDELEQREHDVDNLNNLYRLDHLATRMRRNAESLLVLAGIETGRRPRQAMTISDIVQVAASEIEDYDRVESAVTANPAMFGRHALSAAHMIAELLENACRFSNPGTRVHVTSELVGQHLQIQITDSGIGMRPEEVREANSKITAEGTDYLKTDKLGLYVVGRLAKKLDAPVLLTSQSGAGSSARIDLPVELFESDTLNDVLSESDRHQQQGAPAAAPILAAVGAAAPHGPNDGTMTHSQPGGRMPDQSGQPSIPQWAASSGPDRGGQLDPSAMAQVDGDDDAFRGAWGQGGAEATGNFNTAGSGRHTSAQPPAAPLPAAEQSEPPIATGDGATVSGQPAQPAVESMTPSEPVRLTADQESALSSFTAGLSDSDWQPEFSAVESLGRNDGNRTSPAAPAPQSQLDAGTSDEAGGWQPQFADEMPAAPAPEMPAPSAVGDAAQAIPQQVDMQSADTRNMPAVTPEQQQPPTSHAAPNPQSWLQASASHESSTAPEPGPGAPGPSPDAWLSGTPATPAQSASRRAIDRTAPEQPAGGFEAVDQAANPFADLADMTATDDDDTPHMTEAMQTWQGASEHEVTGGPFPQPDVTLSRNIMPSGSGASTRNAKVSPAPRTKAPKPAKNESGGGLRGLFRKFRADGSEANDDVAGTPGTGSTNAGHQHQAPGGMSPASPSTQPHPVTPHPQQPPAAPAQPVAQHHPQQQTQPSQPPAAPESATPPPAAAQAPGSGAPPGPQARPAGDAMDMLASERLAYGNRGGGISDSLRQRSEVASAALAELSMLSSYSPDAAGGSDAPLARRNRGASNVPPPAEQTGPPRPRDATEVRNMFSGFTSGAARARQMRQENES